PGRDAAGHLLAAPLCRFVPQRDAIVWFWHLEKTCVVRRASECAEERVCLRREIPAYLDKRDDLPVIRQGRIERGQRIGDAAPLLDRRLRGIAAVNRVPHHGPDDAESLQRSPQCFWMKTAAAPNTPAVPGSVPGTILQASHAGLNARRLTSLRSGLKSLSPACVTPPQMTTTSGLK